ncbi:MAG: hypothetical protein ACNA8L_12015 [Luteolibacter sp.]|jgi:hypothetical protein
MMNDPEHHPAPAKSARWYPILLVGLPLWLACSAGGALWYYFHKQEREAEMRRAAFAREISVASLADDLRKFTVLIGERHSGEGEPSLNLMRAASMIEGVLGPSNTGLDIRRLRGPGNWPLLETSIPARRAGAKSVWVITGYDGPPGGNGGEFNASGLSAVIAAIQAAANDVPERHLRFLFLPHVHDPDAPVGDTLRMAAEAITARGEVDAVLWVEAMGTAPNLQLQANQPAALPIDQLADLGSVAAGTHGLEAYEGVPPWLMEAVVRVSTRAPYVAGEADLDMPSPAIATDAAGKLLELLRRIANRVD